MITGVYKIADCVFEIRSLHQEVHQLCWEYRSEEAAEQMIEIHQSDIDFEREKSAEEDLYEKLPIREFSDDYLETLAVYRKIARFMLNQDTLLFHGSAIAVDGEAYLFTAKSGTGKSTHTRLWRAKFGARAIMVNDDKPLLKITPSGVLVCGTPWDGKHRLSQNIQVPLKAICILERDETNHIEPITPRDALVMLFQQSFRPTQEESLRKALALIGQLGSTVPLYRLGCNMDPSAADVAYEGMK